MEGKTVTPDLFRSYERPWVFLSFRDVDVG
jgi:hypothetical protein